MSGLLPVINFSPFMKDEGVVIGNEPTPEQLHVANTMDEACRLHGFLYLTHFGITKALRQQVFSAAHDLFHEDEKVKLEHYSRIDPTTNMGYAPFQTESLNASRPPELKEAYNVRFPPAHTNNYTSCPATFQPASESLLEVIRTAAHRYAMACALALDVPIDFFIKEITALDQATIRFLHCPPCDYSNVENGDQFGQLPLRVGEHTDFGFLTFLLLGEHGAEGLQIKPVEGGEVGGCVGGENEGWLDVQVPSASNGMDHDDDDDYWTGSIINTGALLARWTNDVWKATAHRVIVGSPVIANRERYSVACFIDADSETVIQVHEKFCCTAPDGSRCPPKYEPIKARDYLQMKLTQMMPATSK